jgi:hypothetical protein
MRDRIGRGYEGLAAKWVLIRLEWIAMRVEAFT